MLSLMCLLPCYITLTSLWATQNISHSSQTLWVWFWEKRHAIHIRANRCSAGKILKIWIFAPRTCKCQNLEISFFLTHVQGPMIQMRFSQLFMNFYTLSHLENDRDVTSSKINPELTHKALTLWHAQWHHSRSRDETEYSASSTTLEWLLNI